LLPVYQNAFTDVPMKIAIVVGHNAKAPGAYAPAPIDLSEFDYNNQIADEMLRLSRDNLFNLFKGGQRLELFKVNRAPHTSYSAEIDAAYDRVDAQDADASIELHFNAATPSASGTETLSSGSAKSLSLARYVQDAMVKALHRPDRGIKVLGPADRGGRSLHSARATAILVEPFFSTNSVDLAAAQRVGVAGFAKMYMEGLLAYASSQEADATRGGSGPINPRNVFGTLKLETKDLTKQEFFSRNHALLSLAIENINHIQHERAHGEFLVPLTLVDAFCLMNAEMGLRGAYVDPKHVHSEREIGLLPLPANLVYWNGEDAPLDHSRLSPEQNVSEFLLYLSGIKNKPVGRHFEWGEFYSGLFLHEAAAGDDRAQMHLLAAVVHGWFIRELYRTAPDFGSIASKAAVAHEDPAPVLEELKRFGYKNAIAGDGSIVRNRITNLNAVIPLAMPPTPAPAPEAPIPVSEPEAPTPEPETPTPEPEAPTPESEAPTPESEAPTPESEAPTPEPEAPTPEPSTPSIGSPPPSIGSPLPSIESPPPSIESPLPSIESPLPSIESPLPSIESTPPSIESPLPSIESPTPPEEIEPPTLAAEVDAPDPVTQTLDLASSAMESSLSLQEPITHTLEPVIASVPVPDLAPSTPTPTPEPTPPPAV
jgi:N-acetylmuramoyl-L-alanine amidase